MRHNFCLAVTTVLLIICQSISVLSRGAESKPDLWIYSGDLSFAGQGAIRYKGRNYTVDYRIRNTGTGDLLSSDFFYIELYLTTKKNELSSYYIYLGAFSHSLSLGPYNLSSVLSQKVTIPDTISLNDTQSYYLTILLDSYQSVDEFYENNNIISSNELYTISEPPQGVDLTGEELSFDGSFYRVEGNSYPINYTLMNQGNMGISGGTAINIKYYLSLNTTISSLDIPIGEIDLSDGIPGGIQMENLKSMVTIPSGTDEAFYYLIMRIDKYQKIDDLDIINNVIISENKYLIIRSGSDTPFFMHASQTGAGYSLSVENVALWKMDISARDEIGVFDGSTCVGAGVVTTIWPLKIRAWQDNPQTDEKDGYDLGDPIAFYYWDSSEKMEYAMRAIYLKGDSVFNIGESPELWLIDTGVIILKDGEKIRTTITNDTSLTAMALRSGEGVSIRFDSQGTAGKVLSLTLSTQPFDEIASSPRFSNPVYYVRPEIGIHDFEAEISFKYTDECILEKGIQESALIVAAWNPANESWEEIPSQLDTVQNTLIVSATDFSIFALVSSTETLVTSIENGAYANVPFRFHLYPNYPNPFNPATTIRYDLAKSSEVTIRVFNILGQEVRTLVSSYLAGGAHEAIWDGTNNLGQPVSSGIYIYRMTTSEGFADSKKMLLLR